MPFREGQEVRIRALLEPKRWEKHDARAEFRQPYAGDIGTVVDIDASTGKILYTVECIDTDGVELWAAQFVEEELEVLPP